MLPSSLDWGFTLARSKGRTFCPQLGAWPKGQKGRGFCVSILTCCCCCLLHITHNFLLSSHPQLPPLPEQPVEAAILHNRTGISCVFFLIPGISVQKLQTGAHYPLHYRSGQHEKGKSPARDEPWLPNHSKEVPLRVQQQPAPICFNVLLSMPLTHLSPASPLLTVCTLFLQKFCYKTAVV